MLKNNIKRKRFDIMLHEIKIFSKQSLKMGMEHCTTFTSTMRTLLPVLWGGGGSH